MPLGFCSSFFLVMPLRLTHSAFSRLIPMLRSLKTSLLLTLLCGNLPFATHAMGHRSVGTAQTAHNTHLVKVKIEGIDSNKGKIVLSLYDAPEHYRKHPKQVLRVAAEKVAHEGFSLSLPQGTYAISVYHDANNNGHIDRNFIGIPTERGGFSNNPRIVMGPPSFKSCAFSCTGDMQLTIKLH